MKKVSRRDGSLPRHSVMSRVMGSSPANRYTHQHSRKRFGVHALTVFDAPEACVLFLDEEGTQLAIGNQFLRFRRVAWTECLAHAHRYVVAGLTSCAVGDTSLLQPHTREEELRAATRTAVGSCLPCM